MWKVITLSKVNVSNCPIAVDSLGNIFALEPKELTVISIETGQKRSILEYKSNGRGYSVALDPLGNPIFCSPSFPHLVQKMCWNGSSFVLSTLYVSTGNPYGVAVDPLGNVWVSDTRTHCVTRLTDMKTWGQAGVSGHRDGDPGEALFDNPRNLVSDSRGNIYVSDNYNHCVRRIESDRVVTVAGTPRVNGFKEGRESKLYFPNGICVDGMDNVLVCDFSNSRIRRITPDGVASTFAGKSSEIGEVVVKAAFAYHAFLERSHRFRSPYGIARDKKGKIFVVDRNCLQQLYWLTWAPATHGEFPQEFRAQVKEVMMARKRGTCLSLLPRELVLVVIAELATLEVFEIRR